MHGRLHNTPVDQLRHGFERFINIRNETGGGVTHTQDETRPACIVSQLLEVRVVVQRQQSQELREGLDLLGDALPCPVLREHAHRDPKHRGPTAMGTDGAHDGKQRNTVEGLNRAHASDKPYQNL